MKRVRSNRSLTSSLVRVLTMFIVSTSAAGISSTIIFTSPLSALGATKDPGSRTLLPDLFTGTLSHAIPIDVPPGRKGLDPSLVLSYRSGSGNSWVGVGWDLNTGLYGQEKSITDPNGATISTHYDVFGRKIRVTAPDSSWSTFAYNSLGAGIGVQHARTTNSGGLSTWSYFDGFNRPVIEKRTGPEGKLIVTRTKYDSRGAVVETSLPHFDGATPLWQRMTYDAAGRLLSMQNPDGSRTLNCYKEWVSVSIDANGHRRRETPLGVSSKLRNTRESSRPARQRLVLLTQRQCTATMPWTIYCRSPMPKAMSRPCSMTP